MLSWYSICDFHPLDFRRGPWQTYLFCGWTGVFGGVLFSVILADEAEYNEIRPLTMHV